MTEGAAAEKPPSESSGLHRSSVLATPRRVSVVSAPPAPSSSLRLGPRYRISRDNAFHAARMLRRFVGRGRSLATSGAGPRTSLSATLRWRAPLHRTREPAITIDVGTTGRPPEAPRERRGLAGRREQPAALRDRVLLTHRRPPLPRPERIFTSSRRCRAHPARRGRPDAHVTMGSWKDPFDMRPIMKNVTISWFTACW